MKDWCEGIRNVNLNKSLSINLHLFPLCSFLFYPAIFSSLKIPSDLSILKSHVKCRHSYNVVLLLWSPFLFTPVHIILSSVVKGKEHIKKPTHIFWKLWRGTGSMHTLSIIITFKMWDCVQAFQTATLTYYSEFWPA